MFWAFIKKCRFPDGGVDFYAHVILADGLRDAREKVQSSFAERNVCGFVPVSGGNSGVPLAVLEEIIEFGSSQSESSELYEKACKKAIALSEKEPKKPDKKAKVLPRSEPKVEQGRKEDSCLFG